VGKGGLSTGKRISAWKRGLKGRKNELKHGDGGLREKRDIS
jgi:hypothetical protein